LAHTTPTYLLSLALVVAVGMVVVVAVQVVLLVRPLARL
jgi:hypothetical protein